MYEARQHKDKVSRLNKKPEKKKMRIISPKVAQCDTKDDPFEYGYCFYNKHLSISSGNDLIQESINCRDTTLIDEGSLSRQLNDKNFVFYGRSATYGRWDFSVDVHNVEAYYTNYSQGTIRLDRVKLKGYFVGNNLITHLAY